jgi:hypothetical protein
MQGWGVDVLKVGDVLGIGTLAFWDGEKVVRVEKTNGILCFVESGKKSSKVVVNYSVELAEELLNLVTEIIKLTETESEVFTEIKPGWSCFVTFGIQSLEKDKPEMCIFFKTNQLMKQTEHKNSHVMVLKPVNNKLTWYFGAACEQDTSEVKSMEDFKELMKKQAKFVKD